MFLYNCPINVWFVAAFSRRDTAKSQLLPSFTMQVSKDIVLYELTPAIYDVNENIIVDL